MACRLTRATPDQIQIQIQTTPTEVAVTATTLTATTLTATTLTATTLAVTPPARTPVAAPAVTTPVPMTPAGLTTAAMMNVREGEGVHVTAMTETDALPVVEMPDGLPGFPELRRFALYPLEESGLVQELRSLEDDTVRFVVVPSVVFYPDYAPEIDDTTAHKLGLSEDSDTEPLVLLVVTVGDTLAESTVNLLAPVVINSSTRVAAQVVLDDATLALRAPLSV